MALAQRKVSEPKMDMQETMEVWRKLATPGAPHKMLASRTGNWNIKSRYWMEPNNAPMESTGTCERKMILEGRFLQEDFKGEMMGSPFTGIGITGYDNHAKKYKMSWIDTMSTGIYVFEGTASSDGKTITMEGEFDDPIKGHGKWHGVTRIVDENTEVCEMRGTYENGVEDRCENTYTRVK